MQVIAYLIVSPEHEHLLSCGSRFLNVSEKSQNSKAKILIAASWAFTENKVKEYYTFSSNKNNAYYYLYFDLEYRISS